jgi:iron complex outermembrane receptor protein
MGMGGKKMKSKAIVSTAALATVLLHSAAFAQQVQRSADESGAAGEIVVTAQRRQQSVTEVPLSIQAMTGEQLEKSGVRDLTSLRQITPGLTTSSDSGFVQIFIRGIGNTIYLGADPSVATFIDDVPLIYGSMADNLVDVERVEVLKGAQGGLYGRNATGGVINIITRKPSLERPSMNLRLSYGEKQTIQTAASLNLPVADTVAVSLSAQRAVHDPYVRNLARPAPLTAAMFPGGSFVGGPQQTADFFNIGLVAPQLNDQDFWAVRGKVLFQPSDDFEIMLAADAYDKHDNNGRATEISDPAFSQQAIVGLYNSLGVSPVFPEGFVGGSSRKYTTSAAPDSFVHTKEASLSGTVKWRIGELDLTSITAYRDQKTRGAVNTLSGQIAAVAVKVQYDKHFIYQEFRGSYDAGPLNLLGGVTYLDNKLKGGQQVYFLSEALPIGVSAVRDRVRNWSAYLQAGYDLTDSLTFIASGRYMYEKNRAEFTLPVVSENTSVQKKFVPSATLTYRIPDGNIFLRWARGFKTGGINLTTAPAFYPRPSEGSVFGPETVDTFEAGYRQSLFGRQLQLGASVFYNAYRGIQVFANATDPAITTAVVNAESARTYGAEVELNYRPTPALSFGINAGYLNAKYQDFKLAGSTVLVPFDRSGKQMVNAPKLQLAFTAAVDQPITESLNVEGNLLVSHNSRVLFAYSSIPGITPDLYLPGYWLANGRIGIKTADEKIGVYAVADNIFNTEYFVSGNSGITGNERYFGTPRVVRLELVAKF